MRACICQWLGQGVAGAQPEGYGACSSDGLTGAPSLCQELELLRSQHEDVLSDREARHRSELESLKRLQHRELESLQRLLDDERRQALGAPMRTGDAGKGCPTGTPASAAGWDFGWPSTGR